MAPIARRKKPKDGSGITALPFLLAFAIGSELQVGGLVPKQPCRKSQKKLGRSLMLGDRATVAAFPPLKPFFQRDLVETEKNHGLCQLVSACAYREQMFEVASCHTTIQMDPKMEATMPVLLWLLGVPLVVVVALLLTHVI